MYSMSKAINYYYYYPQECIRKSIPVDREGLTMLKSILPC